MTWQDFINTFNSYPKDLFKSNADDTLLGFLSNVESKMRDEARKIDDFAYSEYGNIDKLQEEIKRIFKDYTSVVSAYADGNISGAILKLKDIIFDSTSGKTRLKTYSYDRYNSSIKFFFRMRSSDSYNIFGRDDMFHISLKKRNVISNQRYSINGFPCLYLGSSLYVCWEETRRPDIEKVNYVAYKYVKSKPLLFLSIDQCNVKDKNILLNLITFILLTKPVEDDKKKYKYEYVLPELLLHSLIDFNNIILNDNVSKDKEKYDGIMYVSNKFFSESCFYPADHDIMLNFVLPIKDVKPNDEFCPHLIDIFYYTEASAIFKERVFGYSHPVSKIRTSNYSNSLFKNIERELVQKKFYRASNTIQKDD